MWKCLERNTFSTVVGEESEESAKQAVLDNDIRGQETSLATTAFFNSSIE
jgi:hypothetical protein